MKNIILTFILACTVSFFQSQQLRYVDTDYILSQIPQYNQAKSQLEGRVNAWKAEIKKEQDEIDALKQQLENERVILTDEKVEEREAVIKDKEDKLNEKIEQKFGKDGESQQLRINLVKPLQDQIWNAISSIAKSKGYHMIFDKGQGANLIYADEKYDITDMVIKELGLDKIESQPKPKTRSNAKSSKIEKREKLSPTQLQKNNK